VIVICTVKIYLKLDWGINQSKFEYKFLEKS